MAGPADTLSLSRATGAPSSSGALAVVAYHRSGVEVRLLGAGAALEIGRDAPADLVIDDPTLSRRHARFVATEEGVRIEDLGSRNGTLVGGRRVEHASLGAGDEVALGAVLVRLERLGGRPPHGLVSHEAFAALVGRELVRARMFGEVFSVLFVGSRDESHFARFLGRIEKLLRPVDTAAAYGPGVIELLLPRVDGAQADKLTALLAQGAEPPLACGLASYPEAATTDALLGRASEALRSARAGRLGVRAPAAQAQTPRQGAPRSAAMRELDETVTRVAAASVAVLVRGETGTGKELVARALHARSARAGGPFVCVNCGAIPATLVESTLFGHVRGAFSGALEGAKGLLEAADGGTIFLDEIGELPPAAQPALLRVIETKLVRPIGAQREVAVDVRVVAATHRDLEAMCREGRFRDDLYYRLATIVLELPPLRARREEIPALAAELLREAAEANGRPGLGLAPGVAELLARYDWPGNVRELKNALDRAVVLARGTEVAEDDLPLALRSAPPRRAPASAAFDPAVGLAAYLGRMEAGYVLEALRAAGWNQTRAAELLGISRRGLLNKMKEHDIRRAGYELAEESGPDDDAPPDAGRG
jgi:DNA-binding NtrC family response regulator